MENLEQKNKKFIDLSMERGSYADVADHKNANRLQKKINSIIKEIATSKEGEDLLFKELSNQNEYVAIQVASFFLDDRPEESLPVLEKISKDSKGWKAAEAFTTIEAYKNKSNLNV